MLRAALLQPTQPRAMLVLAHGAGAAHDHANMTAIAQSFAAVGVSTYRFNFPFIEAGKKRVDHRDVAVDCIRQASVAARQYAAPRLLVGGHSFGGRMASHAVADFDLACDGLVFCAFPLHGVKKPAIARADHLPRINQPMLFLSGTRDGLADADLLQGVVGGLGQRATLHWLDTANHSYVVLKRKRTNPLTVFDEMAQALATFVELVPVPG